VITAALAVTAACLAANLADVTARRLFVRCYARQQRRPH
jgi:hypothetical protein